MLERLPGNAAGPAVPEMSSWLFHGFLKPAVMQLGPSLCLTEEAARISAMQQLDVSTSVSCSEYISSEEQRS